MSSAETVPKRYLSTGEAAAYLGLSPNSVNQSRWSKRLCGNTAPPHITLGRRVMYRIEDLDAWVESNAVEGGAQ
ncbi:helix-turn-helix protein [Halomonas ventosae]|uniref:Helix-turn-helix protein n=1 Tax=Halomonas ventosae TaxID=229007 RepID=A0A4R6ZDP6_9GAMM|nr:helix-turn-helix domain-containing protein [Halomonas ventosae]TDR50213.1 helix-turn-helix protein [Halomonas ventosae]